MQLRREIGREEFDYQALAAALSSCSNPRDKIGALLRKGEIIRVKKGLYVFGEGYSLRPYSRELLANLISGPSFISLDYALAYYGLIPERVEQLTSVTTGRAKTFSTPVGVFVYRPAPLASFHLGMTRVEQGEISFLIATPERALADKVREDRSARVRTLKEAEDYLFQNLRIDPEAFSELDSNTLSGLAEAFSSRKVALCAALLSKTRPSE